MIVWLGLIANGLLISGAWWLAGVGFRQARTLDRVLACSVLSFTWCSLHPRPRLTRVACRLPRIKPALQGVSLLPDRLAAARLPQAGAPRTQTGRASRAGIE
jgi:hypothetical protein